MEGNTLIFATVRKQGILFMVQSKTLTSARGTKENAVAGLVIAQTRCEADRADLRYNIFSFCDRNSGFITTM